MSLFRRENSPPPSSPGGSPEPFGAAQKRRLTHVAAGTRIRGEVTGQTELLIEGEIEGEIRLDATVTVGAEGAVQGPVSAPIVRIGGKVTGNVTAPRIVIAEGAFFKGRVEMHGEENRSATPRPSPPPTDS